MFKRIGSFLSRKAKAVKMMVMGLVVAGAAAATTAADYSPVAKDGTTGDITFTPSNITSPLTDGVVATWGQVAVIILIMVGAGLVIYIIKRK